jgi:hypothetical protein
MVALVNRLSTMDQYFKIVQHYSDYKSCLLKVEIRSSHFYDWEGGLIGVSSTKEKKKRIYGLKSKQREVYKPWTDITLHVGFGRLR